MSKKTLFIVTGIAILFAASLFFIAKLNKQRIIEVDPGFAKYISGYTSGAQSRKASIEIEFADPLPKSISDEQLGKLFTIYPKVAGTLERLNNRIIHFIPSKPMETDQLYTVSFELAEVQKVKSGFENFEFQFSTFPQKLNVELGSLLAYEYTTPDLRMLNGMATTADYVDSAALVQAISAEINSKKLKIKVRNYNGHNELYFRIDSIQRTDEEQRLTVNWNGTSIGTDDESSDLMFVPALGNYSVTSAKAMSEEEGDQYLEINFSETLLPQQNLNGIIKLEGEKNLNFHIEGNTVRVFLPNLLLGNKKLSVSTGIKDGSGYRMKKAYSKDIFFAFTKSACTIAQSRFDLTKFARFNFSV